jgi:hypothetical protein
MMSRRGKREDGGDANHDSDGSAPLESLSSSSCCSTSRSGDGGNDNGGNGNGGDDGFHLPKGYRLTADEAAGVATEKTSGNDDDDNGHESSTAVTDSEGELHEYVAVKESENHASENAANLAPNCSSNEPLVPGPLCTSIPGAFAVAGFGALVSSSSSDEDNDPLIELGGVPDEATPVLPSAELVDEDSLRRQILSEVVFAHAERVDEIAEARTRRNVRCLVFALVLAMLLSVMLASYFGTKNDGGSSSTTEPSAQSPTMTSTIRPIPVPTAPIQMVPPPAEMPSTSDPITRAPGTITTEPSAQSATIQAPPALTTAPAAVDDALYDLILAAAPNSAALAVQDEASPQAFAFNWMIDNTSFGNHSTERILQRYALTVLYFSAEGDGWVNNTNWLVHEDECEWFNKASLTTIGGPCTETGLLLGLDLSRNSLNGALPVQEEFALLTELVVINFNRNPLTGAVPPPLLQGGGVLRNLESIDLANTDIDGPLVDDTLLVSTEPALRRLNLAGTPVSGSVPSSWGAFVNLQDLLLHGTSLTGTMPPAVCENENLIEVSANCDEVFNCTCCTICCYTDIVQQCDYVNN